MMKLKLIAIAVIVTLFLLVLAGAVTAQEETPSPYAGMKNPFPWDDTSVQGAGKELYKRSCLGCHGIDGGNIAASDFSAADYSRTLEERADYYFWRLSEGRLDRGMPPFKSSLSEEERWQVMTYLRSLGTAAAEEGKPSQAPAEKVEGTMQISAPGQGQSGQPLTVTANLRDKQNQPVSGVTVKFFIEADFFYQGLMEIGEAVTNEDGVAALEYTPRQAGDTEIIARYQDIEAAAAITLAESEEPFYEAEAGIRLPAPGNDVLIPESALELREGSAAPITVFRLPAGVISWLLIVVVTVMLIWFTYFRVMYQVFRIPIASEILDVNTRIVPAIGMLVVVILGIILTMMLLTGPYSHLHLIR